MVYFVCSNCGSSLKKNQIEKHTFQCRTSSFSCIDCNKDFYGDEYKSHIKCISEIERYSAKGWKPPANHNKGEKKHNEWMDIVLSTLDKHANSVSPASRNLLHTIAKHDNVPRKKQKFINFINNVSKQGFNNGTINEVWTILECEWKTSKQPVEAATENGNKSIESTEAQSDDTIVKKKKKKKYVAPFESKGEAASENIVRPDTTVDIEGVAPKRKKKSKSMLTSETIPDQSETESGSISKKKKKRELDVSEVYEDCLNNGGLVMETVKNLEESVPKKKKRKHQ